MLGVDWAVVFLGTGEVDFLAGEGDVLGVKSLSFRRFFLPLSALLLLALLLLSVLTVPPLRVVENRSTDDIT